MGHGMGLEGAEPRTPGGGFEVWGALDGHHRHKTALESWPLLLMVLRMSDSRGA